MISNGTAPERLAWVTGSSSGIGAAVAQRLLEHGWQVQGIDHAVPQSPQAFNCVLADLTAPSIESTLGDLLAHGTPGALVHCAGVMHTAPVGQLSPTEGEHMWRLHVQAATTLANGVLPAMSARGSGRCVLIGSRVASGKAGRSQYAASKAALVALARSWAAEVVASGVTVNVVSPAATDTPLLQAGSRAHTPPQVPPLGRLITPAEVAATVAFLLSPEAAVITGQELVLCAGASLHY